MKPNNLVTMTFKDQVSAHRLYKQLASNPVRYSVQPVQYKEYTTSIGEVLEYWEVVYRDWPSTSALWKEQIYE